MDQKHWRGPAVMRLYLFPIENLEVIRPNRYEFWKHDMAADFHTITNNRTMRRTH